MLVRRAIFGFSPALALGFFLLTCATCTRAESAAIPHGTLELVAENQWIAAGHDFNLGLHFELESGWHIYWINPGDSGEPPRKVGIASGCNRRGFAMADATAAWNAKHYRFRLSRRSHADSADARRGQSGVGRAGEDRRTGKSTGVPGNVHSGKRSTLIASSGENGIACTGRSNEKFIHGGAKIIAQTSADELEIQPG